MTSPWQEWKKKNAERQASGVVRPWDFINPDTEYADDDTARARFALCEDCPELSKTMQTCGKCGCYMVAKVKLKHAMCPVGKW